MPVRISSVRIACAVLLGLAALALPSGALAAQEEPANGGPPAPPATTGAVPGHVIVVWKPGVTREERLAARDDADAGFVSTLGDPRFQLLRPQPGQSVAEAIAALREDPNVQTATRDTYDAPHATTNDPLFNQLWGLQNVGANIDGFSGALPGVDVNALAAWDRTRGSAAIVVADIDSGYRFDAPDLAPVAWSNPADPQNGADDDGNGIVDDSHGADFVGNSARAPTTDGDPTDDDVDDGGHGVHTAGTIGAAGNNGIGISGVAQDVRIMPLRVCHPSCPSTSQILAINYAGAHGARAANMSLGGTTANPAVQAALAANPQVLFVISAGNGEDPIRRDGVGDDNDVIPTFPCSYPLDNILCVAALNQADGLAGFSNFGAASVDVGAPGTEILSTFPVTSTLFTEDFETNDIGTKWTMGGSGFGRAGVGDGPLTSFGMTDSPSATPGALSFHQTTLTTGVAVPAGSGSCTLSGRRFLALGADGQFEYHLIPSVGSPVDFTVTRSTSGTSMTGFSTVPVSGLAGTTVRVRFEYTAASTTTASDGVWLDDLELACGAPLSTPPTYGFLDGTSMAAPHVTGSAALLFSLNPSASVAQVRSALLATVHPVAALAGRTTTGGRIDAAAALDEIRQPDTAITGGPRSSTSSSRATFSFARSDAPIAGGFECQLDGGAFAACASPATVTVGGGRHTLAVRALSPHAIVADPSPATATWTLVQCKVPRLKGKSLRRAKRALRAAHCRVGRVKKPRGARAGRLVVRKSKPKAGAVRADGTKVRLTLGRPAPRHRRHGRRHRR
ncbi:MAG TPA: S8 family serine peptidase [Conexibacter sp.]|nr:S8 family serine peptidase [Conexibacter sp.]